MKITTSRDARFDELDRAIAAGQGDLRADGTLEPRAAHKQRIREREEKMRQRPVDPRRQRALELNRKRWGGLDAEQRAAEVARIMAGAKGAGA